ncbi:MAG: dTMP kinase [Defluviitaleaceae bacterium]|nr:dTMP kinase [Defluviitaleaceae bacterium]MCL2264388.1 dTMP kinase [Defluviitaleaceae bacterium]
MKFIVFEGLDGSGKSTQVRMLAQKLEALGLPCISTRQPTDSPIGKVMRAATDAELPLENETMALLVAADRYQHCQRVIKPALQANKYVVCDRYYYSSFAFQGIDDNAYTRVAAYNALAMEQCIPDITFFLDASPEECMNRINEGISDGYGGLYDSVAQQTAVRGRYMKIFDQLKETNLVVFLDGSKGKIEIAADVLSYLKLEA